MDRRQFAAALAAAAVTARWPRPLHAAARYHSDPRRLAARLEALKSYGRQPSGGVSRLGYSEADRDARVLLQAWMREAGLTPRVDVAGNLIGFRPGSRDLPPLLLGSHTDSVPNGGHYDGNLGVLGALEAAQTAHERGERWRHPLEVVVWANEEGGLCGSRAVSGQFKGFELSNPTLSGRTIEEGIAFLDGDPQRLDSAVRRAGEVAGYLELHIEQGGILERTGTRIGVVEGIVGIRWWTVRITGTANHAGTTPMDQRQDALLAAARFIDSVHRHIRATPGTQVGTVGQISVEPGAPNVVPGLVTCSLEIRDLDDAKIEALFDELRALAQSIGRDTGTTFAFAGRHENAAAPSDPRIRALISDAAAALGLSQRAMPSGAGHDAQALATVAPMGMIFVPSVDGISHAPAEFTRPEDCANGAEVLLRAARAADAALDP